MVAQLAGRRRQRWDRDRREWTAFRDLGKRSAFVLRTVVMESEGGRESFSANDSLDLMRSRAVEQEVLDTVDGGQTEYARDCG